MVLNIDNELLATAKPVPMSILLKSKNINTKFNINWGIFSNNIVSLIFTWEKEINSLSPSPSHILMHIFLSLVGARLKKI